MLSNLENKVTDATQQAIKLHRHAIPTFVYSMKIEGHPENLFQFESIVQENICVHDPSIPTIFYLALKTKSLASPRT